MESLTIVSLSYLVLVAPPLLNFRSTKVRIMSPGQHTPPVIHIPDEELLFSICIQCRRLSFSLINDQHFRCFAAVQCVVRAVFPILIYVTTDDWSDVCAHLHDVNIKK